MPDQFDWNVNPDAGTQGIVHQTEDERHIAADLEAEDARVSILD